MLTGIALYNPDFVINCSQLESSADIYQIMRKRGIKKSYVYGMCYKTSPLKYDFLKVGMSSPSLREREHQVGERVTRQLSWVPGWPGEHVRSSHGADFWIGIEHHLIPAGKAPSSINRNDMVIAIWDISARMMSSDLRVTDEYRATCWAEGELASQYKELNGRLPYLNVRDPATTKAYREGYIKKSTWDSLFS